MKPDLDAIRARCEAATPGPWEVSTLTYPDGTTAVESITGASEPQWSDYGDGKGEWFTDRLTLVETDSGVYGPTMPNALFIAHARTDIPALLAHIEELQRERDEAKLQSTFWARAYDGACAKIDMLEHMLAEERENVDTLRAAVEDSHPAFASCNRARQHCELECEDLRKRVAKLEGRDCLPPVNHEHEAIVDGMLAKAREGVTKRPIGTYSPGETEWASRIAHAEARFVEEYDMRKAAERQIEELKARIVALEANRNDEMFDGTDAAHPAYWRGNDAGVRGTVNAVHRMLAGAIPDSAAFGAEELNDLHARIKSMLAEIAELKARIVTLEAMR